MDVDTVFNYPEQDYNLLEQSIYLLYEELIFIVEYFKNQVDALKQYYQFSSKNEQIVRNIRFSKTLILIV